MRRVYTTHQSSHFVDDHRVKPRTNEMATTLTLFPVQRAAKPAKTTIRFTFRFQRKNCKRYGTRRQLLHRCTNEKRTGESSKNRNDAI